MTELELLQDEVADKLAELDGRYGPPASTHESLGVITEEMAELISAIRSNKIQSIRMEAFDVAVSALRLVLAVDRVELTFKLRSGCQ